MYTSEIKKVMIIGFGVMGRQIGQLFAQKGFQVIGTDVNKEILEKSLHEIMEGKYGLKKAAARGKITEDEADKAFRRISVTTKLEEACKEVDFVIEAVMEEINIKKDVFKKLDKYCDKNIILSTNTSTLSVTEIASACEKPERVIGMHFFNPPQIMKLIEIIKGLESSEETIRIGVSLAKKLNKYPVIVRDYPGFATSRLGIALFLEACDMLEKNIASIQDIDIAMRLGYGYPMGPFELCDLVGLDARMKNIEALYKQTNDPKWKVPTILRQLVLSGYIGDPNIKPRSKGGFYEYYKLKRPKEILSK